MGLIIGFASKMDNKHYLLFWIGWILQSRSYNAFQTFFWCTGNPMQRKPMTCGMTLQDDSGCSNQHAEFSTLQLKRVIKLHHPPGCLPQSHISMME